MDHGFGPGGESLVVAGQAAVEHQPARWVGRAEKGLPRQTPRRAADPTAWLTGYRRIARRHEHDHLLYFAFCDLAAIITCHKRLAKLITEGKV